MLGIFKEPLKSGMLSDDVIALGLKHFDDVLNWTWRLPYGRTSDRADYRRVPIEKKGACSTKHAFLAALAEEQAIDIALYVGIFMMGFENTPKVRKVLSSHKLREIPEAHSYLKYKNQCYDFTDPESFSASLRREIEFEEQISPTQIGEYKIKLQRQSLDRWRRKNCPNLTLDFLWEVREECIQALS